MSLSDWQRRQLQWQAFHRWEGANLISIPNHKVVRWCGEMMEWMDKKSKKKAPNSIDKNKIKRICMFHVVFAKLQYR